MSILRSQMDRLSRCGIRPGGIKASISPCSALCTMAVASTITLTKSVSSRMAILWFHNAGSSTGRLSMLKYTGSLWMRRYAPIPLLIAANSSSLCFQDNLRMDESTADLVPVQSLYKNLFDLQAEGSVSNLAHGTLCNLSDTLVFDNQYVRIHRLNSEPTARDRGWRSVLYVIRQPFCGRRFRQPFEVVEQALQRICHPCKPSATFPSARGPHPLRIDLPARYSHRTVL